ncbi:hypothetical protein PENTCL1PPCAC_4152, partial [Pristionchus entomophagus]
MKAHSVQFFALLPFDWCSVLSGLTYLTKSRVMGNKRLDIQGIRAWAVLAVVIFHFFPSIFPWGYIGVDMFFVLSGFLISMVLESKPNTVPTYFDFFFKRFRRILPLALFISFIILLIISQEENLELLKFGTRSAIYALFFGTNYNVRDEEDDYFEALENATDYFTHFWSLSVEIQFYTLAPMLLHMLKPTHKTRLLVYLSSIAVASFAFSLYLPPQDAFMSTLSRLWQFLAGSMAFTLRREKTEEPPPTDAKEVVGTTAFSNFLYLIPICAILVGFIFSLISVFLAGGVSASLLRLAVTVTAVFLLLLQSTSWLFCHRSLQLLGDASYALYLVHWPVICLLKKWELDDTSYLLSAMMTCIAFSIVIHFTFERWYLNLPGFQIVALVGLLYLLCGIVIYRNMTDEEMDENGNYNPAEMLRKWEPGSSINFTNAQVRAMNKILEKQKVERLTVPGCTQRDGLSSSFSRRKKKTEKFGFCNAPDGSGKLSFLIIGNSYSLNTGQ